MTAGRAKKSAPEREHGHKPIDAPVPRSRHRTRLGALVLIVDDSSDTRDLYATYFRHRGFRAITAVDGDAGIRRATHSKPDLIVMDLAMPKVNGISTAHHLKNDPRTRKIPIILLTGYGARAIEEGALEMGIDLFLTKPCLPEALEHEVRRLLDRRAPHRS
jgi:two-component system cell cycle response regulator DivK